MSKEEMIDCEEALSRLFEFIDHELNPVHNDEMDEHMSRCRSCYSRLEFEKRLREHLQDAAQEKASDELHNKVKCLIKKL